MALNETCLKRIKGDFKLLKKQPLEFIDAYPNEKNLLEWYFLIKGPPDTEYKDGLYIGKILHSEHYPFRGPDYIVLTPTGRFTADKKICLTNSAYHPESWSPMWNIRNMLEGFLSVMVADQERGISHIPRTKNSKEQREKMAKDSYEYNMKNYPEIFTKFKRFVNDQSTD